MDRSLKCPNCGANIFVDESAYIARCEYCRSEIPVDPAIPDRYHAAKAEAAVQEEMQAATEAYNKNIVKWKRKVRSTTVLVVVTMVLFGIFMEYASRSAGGLMAVAGVLMSFVFPITLSSQKPLRPMEKPIPTRVASVFLLYLRYCGAWWLGVIISAIVCAF